MIWDTDNFCVYGDGWQAENVRAQFDVATEWVERDFDLGITTSKTVVSSVEFLTFNLGCLKITRDQLAEATTKAEVEEIERCYLDLLQDRFDAGEFDTEPSGVDMYLEAAE